MVRTSRATTLLIVLGAVALAAAPSAAFAATQPRLGTALNFTVLAGTTITNTGPTVITGQLGIHPGNAVTGFPPGSSGAQHIADATAGLAKDDLVTAYNDAANAPTTSDMTGQNLAGKDLKPGVYAFSSSAYLNGPLTLDGDGVFIFKVGSALTTGSADGSLVRLINGAQACAVFWQVTSSATIGTGTQFQGTVMALESISMVTGATLTGRAFARNAALTLQSNTITPPSAPCTVPKPTNGTTGGSTSASPTPALPAAGGPPSTPVLQWAWVVAAGMTGTLVVVGRVASRVVSRRLARSK